ncbi:MAG: hypothetical protein CMM07_14295 [Rhodopirellula sp.]|nr:hypothetical protein [Rhodopirellula sp.]
MAKGVSCIFGLTVLLAGTVLATEAAPKWMTEGPKLVGPTKTIDVPLTVRGTKLYVTVDLGGKPRRFVVDTGSPSMISSTLVKELGLETIGRSQGVDAHGVVIESEIVESRFKLGGVEFSKVPMFAADFQASEALKYFIGDGVLGSELLKLGAWQLDLKNFRFRFSQDVTTLPNIKDSTEARLYDFGYPHVPIMDVRFAPHARSKAMFDTGCPSFFTISPADLNGAQKAGGIGGRIIGNGSAGGSLGGQAPGRKQVQAELKTVAIGELDLGRVAATGRASSPSLIGARILEHFIVTFDVKSKTAFFFKFSDKPLIQPSFGFSLAFDNLISVAVCWDNSPAAGAGLRPGTHITKINGETIRLTSEGIRKAITAMEGQEISLEWEGGSVKLVQKALVFHR